ncbi:hypothetical protein [Aporhodopirellula aestuarii]|uniref:Transmembrane protein n=1 Tax=Aporhodopirellula aestuarii TaxID=2950107 RepID=A0ABT0U8F3_9BACT|nr:hypothetical protein [Aporhodopirellula aestuarii]MCM2372805.1 hypothetical protein [Aporhodopirellula aestuarii]
MNTDNLETVADLIARLGTPPSDIAEGWLADARSQIDSFSATSFDESDRVWERFHVNEHGRLLLLSDPEDIEAETPDVAFVPDFDTSSDAKANVDEQTAASNSGKRFAMRAIAVGGILAIGVAAYMMRGDDSTLSDSNTIAMPSTASQSPRDRSSDANTDDGSLILSTQTLQSDGSADTLETVMESHEMSSSDVLSGERSIDTSLLGVSLDSFLPSTTLDSSVESAPSIETDRPNTSEPTAATEEGESHPVASIDIEARDGDDDEMLEDAEEQATETIPSSEPQTIAIAIPQPPATPESELPPPTLLLARDSAPQDIELEFPDDVPLRLRRVENTDRWVVTEDQSETPLAMITSGLDDEAGLSFRWLAEAATSRRCEALANGRLRTDDGATVHLRSHLDADPILLNLRKRDEKLKWNLGGPIVAGATRLTVSIHVPDDVSIQWIEPFDETSPRNTRGIAVLTLKDSPDASALAVRIDVRTTASLTIRVRFGGRLGPAMPWQWTDAKTIRSTLDAVTGQLQLADEQLLMLDTAISRATKLRARRQELTWEMQRDQIEEAVRGGTAMAKRLAELDQLVALLDADGRITSELNVHWPDGAVQTLLSLR